MNGIPLVHDPAGRDAMNLMDYFAAHAPPVPDVYPLPRRDPPPAPETPRWNPRAQVLWNYFLKEGMPSEKDIRGLGPKTSVAFRESVGRMEAWYIACRQHRISLELERITMWRWEYARSMTKVRAVMQA